MVSYYKFLISPVTVFGRQWQLELLIWDYPKPLSKPSQIVLKSFQHYLWPSSSPPTQKLNYIIELSFVFITGHRWIQLWTKWGEMKFEINLNSDTNNVVNKVFWISNHHKSINLWLNGSKPLLSNTSAFKMLCMGLPFIYLAIFMSDFLSKVLSRSLRASWNKLFLGMF